MKRERNLISLSSVAACNLIGMFTRPKLMLPFHIVCILTPSSWLFLLGFTKKEISSTVRIEKNLYKIGYANFNNKLKVILC